MNEVAVSVRCTVNGRDHELVVDPGESLLRTLRDRLHLTGTKEGCVEGECGACTVLVDGQPADSCIYPAGAAEGPAARRRRLLPGSGRRTGRAAGLRLPVAGAGAAALREPHAGV